jgi:hypothetical protein
VSDREVVTEPEAPEDSHTAPQAAAEGQPAPEPPAGPAPAQRPGISWRDRVIVFGQTGSGKSVLLNHLFAGYRCQRVLLDTKDEFRIDGVEPTTRVESIDWTQPVIHYIDDRGDLREYDKLFKAFIQRRQGRVPGPRNYGLKVCVHEAGDLCGDNPGRTPQWVSAYTRKGRAHGQGMDAGSQRPVNLPKVMRTETQHVFVMAKGEFDPDDYPVIAQVVGVPEATLKQYLAQAAGQGDYAYLWCVKGPPRRIFIRPPLPAERIGSMVQGLE